jgi:pimeloyl-ACP methyl ester carboxylesterase
MSMAAMTLRRRGPSDTFRSRMLARSAVLLASVLLAGCGTAPSTASPVASPSPSQIAGLVQIGGGRGLEMFCRGTGQPAVILDAGLGNTADVWDAVETRLSDVTTVCAYDRAGLGGSDPRPLPHGAGSAADDLEALLHTSGLRPPFVMVGASYGGLVIQLFARRHPAETAGVVLVDAIAPGWDDRLEAILTPAQVAERRAIPNGEPISNEEIRSSERDVAAAAPFPPLPLVVLRHGLPFPLGPGWPSAAVETLWASIQDGLATLSPRSVVLVGATSGHRIHQDQPDLVADAIRAIIDPSRWPPTEPPPPVAFGTGAPAASLEPGAGVLAFTQDDGLHLSRIDGSGDRVVVASDGMLVGEPSIDRTAALLAFTRRPRPLAIPSGPQPTTPAEVWVIELRTGTERRLAADGELPTVAPDGSLVAFSERARAFVIRPDGTGLREIGDGACSVWSPDSRSLAMCAPDGTAYLLDVASGARTPIRTGADQTEPTAWSTDGMTIALVSARGGDSDIYLVGSDGTGERLVTVAPGDQFADAWLPSGLLVTSSLPGADASDWFIVDPATGAPQVVRWLAGYPIPISFAPAP